jgi:hypothetical protein
MSRDLVRVVISRDTVLKGSDASGPFPYFLLRFSLIPNNPKFTLSFLLGPIALIENVLDILDEEITDPGSNVLEQLDIPARYTCDASDLRRRCQQQPGCFHRRHAAQRAK